MKRVMNRMICRYCYSAQQKICEKIGEHFHRGGKVFMFHQVTDDATMWADDNCAISKKGFEKFISTLYDRGCVFAAIDELMESGYAPKIFLTFDDIYTDVIENALPILKERNIPFCVFISYCYIGQNGYISEEQLLELANDPLCTIGYHTKSHIILRHMPDRDVISEIIPDVLEDVIGKKIKYFAYPYGSLYAVSKKNVRAVREMGYKLAFSTLRLEIDEKIKQKFDFFLPRFNINESNYIRYSNSIYGQTEYENIIYDSK